MFRLNEKQNVFPKHVPVPRRLEGKARERKGEGAVPNKFLVGSKIVPVLQGLNYLVPAYIKLSQTGS